MKSQIVHMSQKRKRTGGEDDLKENVGIIFMDTTDICMGVPESLEKQYVQYIRELEKDREEGFAAKDAYIMQLEKEKEEGFKAKDIYIGELERDREEGFATKDMYIHELEERVIQVENEYLEIVKSKNEYIDRVEVLYNKEKQANRELLKDMRGILRDLILKSVRILLKTICCTKRNGKMKEKTLMFSLLVKGVM